jgi:hypothetical protein
MAVVFGGFVYLFVSTVMRIDVAPVGEWRWFDLVVVQWPQVVAVVTGVQLLVATAACWLWGGADDDH